jgi:hypothetical protein
MSSQFISERLEPLETSFDPVLMASGAPSVPGRFRWRKKEIEVAAILKQWKDHGDCAHGSGERYVRRHCFRVQTTEGAVLRIYFQRTFGRARFEAKGRWWVLSAE